jgi:glucokinase
LDIAINGRSIDSDSGLVAGVDVGATRLRVALCSPSGEVIAKATERSTHEASRRALGIQVTDCISRLLKKSGNPKMTRVGVATTGPLDRRGGINDPANLPKLGFVPLAEPLLQAFGSEVVLMNDCAAAVLAEREKGKGRGADDMVYVTLSTGIGAGVFESGRLLLGKDGNAHEVGHMVIDCEGRLVCGCGKSGHWEAYCSGRNIPRLASLVLDERAEAIRVGALTSAEIFEASQKGDGACSKVVEEVGLLNSMGFANIVNVYDPEIIIVGGSVALNNPSQILGPIKKRMRDFTRNRPADVGLTGLGEDSVLKGAMLAALISDRYPELSQWTFR